MIRLLDDSLIHGWLFRFAGKMRGILAANELTARPASARPILFTAGQRSVTHSAAIVSKMSHSAMKFCARIGRFEFGLKIK